MTIDTDRLPELDDLFLTVGTHASWEDGACLLEAVSYIAGEPFSDHPKCVSTSVAKFLRSWNDAMDDDDRQTLKLYVPRLVGSRGTTGQEEQRSWMALDWLVRVQAPAWLRLAGLTSQADLLAAMDEVNPGICLSIKPVLQTVRSDVAVAWAAAWNAARATKAAERDTAADAAWDAIWIAAWDAIGAVAGAAIWVAEGAIAWAAERAAAWDAAGDATWGAAATAAGAAARAAEGAATGDATGAAIRGALRPTVVELQASAHQLVDRMLTVTETTR